jgi:uncharacterized protein (DUF1501 family)
MKEKVPPRSVLSRRAFLRESSKAGLALSLFGLVQAGRAQEKEKFTGELVLITQTGASPDKALP